MEDKRDSKELIAPHAAAALGAQPTFMEGAVVMLKGGPLNILLLCIPIALISWAQHWSDGVTFIFALLAIAPLAERLGFVTEQLALHTNETVGGLLNATFGNATELIVAITALSKNLFILVQLSLLGSVISNMLLVLGSSFLLGGYYNKEQTFGKVSGQVNATLLMLSVMGLLFPSIMMSSGVVEETSMLGLSRFTSLVLLLMYLAFLYFQLYSHSYLYEEEAETKEPLLSLASTKRSSNQELSDLSPTRSDAHVDADNHSNSSSEEESPPELTSPSDDDETEDQLGFHYAIGWLAVITVLIAFLSDALSDTIEDAASGLGLSAVFVSAIVLPIVGNAAEHAGAVMFAAKNKLDLTLGIAIGSSTQIALFVMPLLVIIGWMMDKDMNLNFGLFESWSVFLTVTIVMYAIKDGTSNYLQGLVLIAAYFLIAAGFWARQDEDLTNS